MSAISTRTASRTRGQRSPTKPRPKTAKKPSRAKKIAAAPKPETVLVLRTCDAQMKSHGGFVWPKSGPVACSDWSKEPVCGQGLHGLLWGEGDGELCNHGPSANWLVVEVLASEIVDLQQKVKFPRGTVVFCGSAFYAAKYIAERAPNTVRAIVRGTSTSGDRGTSTSGDRGTSTSGYGGTSTSGDGGTSTSGYRGTSTSGDGGTSMSGDGGTSTSGYGGTSTSGYGGTSTSGDGGTSTSGYGGTSTSGDRGTSTSGYGGTSTSGDRGEIRIKWWDEKTNRYRTAIGYIGEDGLLAGVGYCIREGKFIRKDGE